MDTTELADAIAAPISDIGMAHYFHPLAEERAAAAGSNRFFLYAIGRGGVLGDVETSYVEEQFFFFKDGMIAGMYEKGKQAFTPQEGAVAALEVAYELARTSLGEIDEDILVNFSEAARAIFGNVSKGAYPLVDGYLALRSDLDPDAEALFNAIVLRELRNSVHIDAVRAAGLTAAQACQLDKGGAAFALHGYGDEDRTEETAELVAAREEAERDTTARMVALLEPLSDAQREALLAGTTALATVFQKA
jgi:hypothetical protein